MKTLAAIALFSVLALAACKEKKQSTPPPAVTTTQPAPKPAEQPKPQPKPQPQPEVKAEPHYFLIAGCFEYKSNAERLVEQLKQEGFSDARVLDYYENLYLVAYSGYPTRSEAARALQTMQQDTAKLQTWIHYAR